MVKIEKVGGRKNCCIPFSDHCEQFKQSMTGHLYFCGDPVVTNFMLYLFCGKLINCFIESF